MCDSKRASQPDVKTSGFFFLVAFARRGEQGDGGMCATKLPRMLWVKSLHIVFVASWFAGLFYLPRIFVNLAMVPPESVAERERLPTSFFTSYIDGLNEFLTDLPNSSNVVFTSCNQLSCTIFIKGRSYVHT